uniref:Uncharacterized protein n=1 Tax=Anguilla anguilla TaxID=7936 RepID=A0A0E9RR80_ANGAN
MLKNINYAINYLEFPDLYIHREVTKRSLVHVHGNTDVIMKFISCLSDATLTFHWKT